MIPLVFLLAMQVVALKVFKKTSPNGRSNQNICPHSKFLFINVCTSYITPVFDPLTFPLLDSLFGLFQIVFTGKITVYLGKRDFVDRCDGVVDPVDGVIVIDSDYLQSRKVYGEVSQFS